MLYSLRLIRMFLLYIQTVFYYAAALQYDEIIRALSTVISKYSSTSIRGRFSRLREIMSILTSEYAINNIIGGSGAGGGGGGGMNEVYIHLTTSQILTFQSLRLDMK